MNKISIVMITKNAALTLEKSLNSLKEFDEVLIYDNGSTDATLDIITKFDNISLHQGEFLGFGPTKAHAANLARNDWIFSLDADETITQELGNHLLNMSLPADTCFEIRRDNYYRNKHIKCCGWYPEYITRLYNKKTTNFSNAMVHETVETKKCTVAKLPFPINHYSFHSVSDFLVKIQNYSEIYANDMKGKKDASIFKAFSRGLFAFIKSYFFRKGCISGFEGFVIAMFHGLGTTVKYLKLHEKNRPQQ